MKTISDQIESIESDIKKNEARLDEIERLGRLTNLSDEECSDLLHERKVIKKRLDNSRKQLRELRWENWRSMIVSVLLMGLIYGTYHIISSNSGEPVH